MQKLAKTNYRSQVRGLHEVEFYFKPKTRAIIFTGDAINKAKKDYSTYVSPPALQSFLETYMKREDAEKGNAKNSTDNSPSGKDFCRMCRCVSYANGDAYLTKKLFSQSNPKEREGEYKTKWNNADYIERTFQAAKIAVEEKLKSTCKTMPKNGKDRYLYFGEKFFESIQKDRKEFIRSKNYLYSFLRILREVNRQYSEHVNSQTQKIGKNPWIYVNYKDIAEIMDCSSVEKAIGILQALEELGYLQYNGVFDLCIIIKKFYAQDKYGVYAFQKGYVCLDKAIFEDYFLRAKCKSSKLDLLLYLYANAEYCSREEYRKRIRCMYTVAFGYRYDNKHKHRQKRYDISEKELASFLNISTGTLCDQLKDLQKLHYIYMRENGSRYNRGIFITLCNFDAYKFKKYGKKGEGVHEKTHQDLRDCLKVRGLSGKKAKATKDNFLNRAETVKVTTEKLNRAA